MLWVCWRLLGLIGKYCPNISMQVHNYFLNFVKLSTTIGNKLTCFNEMAKYYSNKSEDCDKCALFTWDKSNSTQWCFDRSEAFVSYMSIPYSLLSQPPTKNPRMSKTSIAFWVMSKSQRISRDGPCFEPVLEGELIFMFDFSRLLILRSPPRHKREQPKGGKKATKERGWLQPQNWYLLSQSRIP